MRRNVLRLVLCTVVLVASVEVALQIASLFAPARGGGWAAGSTHHTLCVGDSHTWGAGVERGEAYPAQVQRFLDEAEPGVHSVINLGVPGMNTAQVRRRLPSWLSRYEPDVLVVWVGVNNAWNTADSVEGAETAWRRLDRALLRSRLYRLARVLVHDLTLESYDVTAPESRVWHLESERAAPMSGRHVAKHDGVVEEIEHRREKARDLGATEASALGDLDAIAEYAEAAGARVVFVTYPLDLGAFVPANMALWRVAELHGLAVVHARRSLARVPEQRRQWLWGLHPDAALYSEVGRDVARAILDRHATNDDDIGLDEYRDAIRTLTMLRLRAARQVARAVSPVTDAEERALAGLHGLAGVDLAGHDLPAITPGELAARLRDQPVARLADPPRLLATLRQLALVDGTLDDAEAGYIDEFERALAASRVD